jgi:nitrate reductase NapAB chaperone NapD
MEVLRSQEVIVRAAEKRHETLMKQVAGKAKFATERSRVTNLLADLQTIFPEDAWAENITIANLDKNKFQCDIQAFAYSSGKVSMVLDSIRTIKGLSNARLVYSEQTLLPDKSKAIRFKITGEWK